MVDFVETGGGMSYAVCLGRLDPIYIVTYCIKWVNTSWTDSISLCGRVSLIGIVTLFSVCSTRCTYCIDTNSVHSQQVIHTHYTVHTSVHRCIEKFNYTAICPSVGPYERANRVLSVQEVVTHFM